MVYTNNGAPTPSGTVTLEEFAAMRCKSLESSKKLLDQANVLLIQYNDTYIIRYMDALALIDAYYETLLSPLDSFGLLQEQAFWGTKEYMELFIEAQEVVEADLIFEISDGEFTNLSDLFDHFLEYRSPLKFLLWFHLRCDKFMLKRIPSQKFGLK